MTSEVNKNNDEIAIKRVIEGVCRGVSRQGPRWGDVHLCAGDRDVRRRA